MSAVVVTLFFGGPDGPVPHIPSFSIWFPIVWFLAKVFVFLFIYVWLRAALPRLRYDQLMTLGWKYLIPLSLGWLLAVAGFVVDGWWGLGIAVVAAVAGRRAHPGVRRRPDPGGACSTATPSAERPSRWLRRVQTRARC